MDPQTNGKLDGIFNASFNPLKEMLTQLVNTTNANQDAIKILQQAVASHQKNIDVINTSITNLHSNSAQPKEETNLPKPKRTSSILVTAAANATIADLEMMNEKTSTKMKDIDVEIKRLKIGYNNLKNLMKNGEKNIAPKEVPVSSNVNDFSSEKIELLKLEIASIYTPQTQYQALAEKVIALQKALDDMDKSMTEQYESKESKIFIDDTQIQTPKTSSKRVFEDDKRDKQIMNFVTPATRQTKIQKIVIGNNRDEQSFRILNKRVLDVEVQMSANANAISSINENVERIKQVFLQIDKKAEIIDLKMVQSELSM